MEVNKLSMGLNFIFLLFMVAKWCVNYQKFYILEEIFIGDCFIFQIMVEHPAAKTMIEIARTQDEEVGDGTTSVVILGKSTC